MEASSHVEIFDQIDGIREEICSHHRQEGQRVCMSADLALVCMHKACLVGSDGGGPSQHMALW